MNQAAEVAREDERTARAKQIAGGEQRHDQQAPIVDPGDDRGEAGGVDPRAEEAVNNDERCDQEQDELDRSTGVAPSEDRSDDGPLQDVYAVAPRCHAQLH